MKIKVLTIFPDIFEGFLSSSLIGKAVEKGSLQVELIDIRKFTEDKHSKVDDVPYGGGPGMVMTPQPVADAIKYAKSGCMNGYVVHLTPQGELLKQQTLKELSELDEIILLNGRYEGIDERIRDLYVDREISIGDYVLNGGETASMVLIEGFSRLIPDFMGNTESTLDESHSAGLLEYPHYTRPAIYSGIHVPEILLSGHHENIRKWRRKMSLIRTKNQRPDLFDKVPLTAEDIELLKGEN
ncbi:MAG: tRNA (guanosine(37)-N1)-methyltransferase TrmD [Deltaproteobacteria bacterium]|nr:tRNA (guanosine(37)-N1)-methyltransferase TrmD [Deltaproteobacteria bacterium]